MRSSFLLTYKTVLTTVSAFSFGVLLTCLTLLFGSHSHDMRPYKQNAKENKVSDHIRPLQWASNDNLDPSYLINFRSPYIKEHPIEYSGRRHSSKTCGCRDDEDVRKQDDAAAKKLVVMYNAPSYLPQMSDLMLFGHCPVSDCTVSYSYDRDGTRANAVVFHGTPDGSHVPPARASPSQVYIYLMMEPPTQTSTDYQLTVWNQAFNWSWSYRLDADIWTPVAYLKRSAQLPSLSLLREITRNKTKAVAWFVSQCRVQSKRMQYVQRLQKIIPVDIFGKCGDLKCTGRQCEDMLSKDYLFYLSYENSFCVDYVTEKFFKVFYKNVHVVPVVRGGATYSRYFPLGTYIDTELFDSPEDLGHHLLALMAEEDYYVDILWRKAHFEYHEHGIVDAWCQLCNKLHNLDQFSKTYPDFFAWNHKDKCWPPKDF